MCINYILISGEFNFTAVLNTDFNSLLNGIRFWFSVFMQAITIHRHTHFRHIFYPQFAFQFKKFTEWENTLRLSIVIKLLLFDCHQFILSSQKLKKKNKKRMWLVVNNEGVKTLTFQNFNALRMNLLIVIGLILCVFFLLYSHLNDIKWTPFKRQQRIY